MTHIPYRRLFISIALLSFSLTNFSQKKQLDHSVYDGWKSLQSISISDDGKFVSTIISPQEGDSTLYIRDLKTEKELKIHRVNKYTLSPDGKFTVGLIKVPFVERREARIKKKKAEDMPKDSLIVINNATLTFEKIADVKSFSIPEKNICHIAYKKMEQPDTAKNNDKSKKSKEILIVRNLLTQGEDTVRNAKNFVFSKFGNSFAAIIEPEKKDSTDTPGVLYFDLKNNLKKRISNEKIEYKSLSFDENGNQLVYIATSDTSKVEQKTFDVRYFNQTTDSAIILAEKNASGLPKGWIFNEFSSPRFSKDGKRILIGAAPKQAPKDTTIVDFEMAQLDIWHWQEALIPPQQLTELKREQNRVYTGVIYPDHPNQFIAVANEEMPFAAISDENNGRFALLWSDKPYQMASQWDVSPKNDVWIWDFQTNSLHLVAKALGARPSLSPQGNYSVWWDAEKREWFAYDNQNKTVQSLTKDIDVNFWNEENDVPSLPGSYGISAWGQNDDFVLINDAFDIWKIDPRGVKKAENITKGIGRTDSIRFRYVNTDPEKRFIEPKDVLLLSAFDKKTKKNGYYTLKQKGRNPLEKKALREFTFSDLNKAKNTDIFAYQRSNFATSPNLYVTKDFQMEQQLTDINPQMRDYNWGTAEMFSWKSFTGVPLQGILYKPENFDPTKKYPVMIYFYEKHSDELFRYFTPAPSRSTVNIPFFVSRGYIVFTPDIHYTVGNPGEDAYNSIVSGAEELAKNEWVDKDNMAIQGQSWGGYQVAYLITRTDMFKAAGAGAPVSNMTSAYGGIRWESGRSRQFQYEQTQSRIGATMSDSLQLYIDNSPVFFADKVNTPLLIMHNDNDGAVPWYQGIEYFMSLRRLGKPVWMLQYNKEAHNLRERRNSKDLSIRLQQFFDHYLKGAPAPVWMTRGVPAIEKGKTWGYEVE